MRPLLENKVPSLVSGLQGDFKQGTSRDYLKYKTEELEELRTLETLLLPPGQKPRHIPYSHPAPTGRKGQIPGI